jgi:hypothetical protein
MNAQDSHIKDTFNEFCSDPDKRFQKFFSFYCDVQLIDTFPIERYMRSGKELIRMANIYYQENDDFHAFVLYSRFIMQGSL